MSKRKREKGEPESVGGSKHKRVKEHSEDTPKAAEHQASVETTRKAPKDPSPAPGAEGLSKALKRLEAKRLKKQSKEAGDLGDRERDGSHISKASLNNTESTTHVPTIDPSNKAFERQEAKKRRKEKRKAENSEDQDGVRLGADAAVSKSLRKIMSKKKTYGKGHKDKSPAWKVSEAAGGQMLDLDPLFSHNEE